MIPVKSEIRSPKSEVQSTKYKFMLRLILLLLMPCLVLGQTSKHLTLDEAIKLGLDASKQLKASNTKIDLAKVKLLQYKYATIPAINASVGYSRISDNIDLFKLNLPNLGEFVLNPQILNQFTNKLSVSQLLYAGGRAVNTLQSGEFLQKAAELDYTKDQADIRLNIINACYNLYKLQETNSLLNENISVFKGRLADITNYVKQGTAIENDALRAQLAVSTVETTKAEVENGIAVSNYNLAIMLGLPETITFELDKNSMTDDKAVAALESYLQSAPTARPDIQAADWRQKAVAKSLDIAKGNNLPIITAGANLNYSDPNQRVFPVQDAFKATWDVGVTVSYNFANLFSNKFNVQEAQVNIAQTNLLREQLTDGAKMEVNAAWYAYQTALKKVTLNDRTIEQATENQRVMKKRYENQVAIIGELLDADFLVTQAKINQISAKADANNAYYKLLKVSGK